jgi:hypothetical protein
MQMAGCENFTLHAPKGVLASRLSVKPETFSRILNNLTNKRVIEVKSNRIKVVDSNMLQEMAHTESLIGLGAPVQNPCPLTGPKTV